MHRRIRVLGLLILCACQSTPPAQTPSLPAARGDQTLPLPKSLALRVGQSLVVVLPASKGADFTWRVQSPMPRFLTLSGVTTQSSVGGVSGTPDQQVFSFDAVRVGEGQLSFTLNRLGDPNGVPIEVRSTRVLVTSP